MPVVQAIFQFSFQLIFEVIKLAIEYGYFQRKWPSILPNKQGSEQAKEGEKVSLLLAKRGNKLGQILATTLAMLVASLDFILSSVVFLTGALVVIVIAIGCLATISLVVGGVLSAIVIIVVAYILYGIIELAIKLA